MPQDAGHGKRRKHFVEDKASLYHEICISGSNVLLFSSLIDRFSRRLCDWQKPLEEHRRKRLKSRPKNDIKYVTLILVCVPYTPPQLIFLGTTRNLHGDRNLAQIVLAVYKYLQLK